MGRYVTGDFSYKFAFGAQNSELGEILSDIFSESVYNDVNNYVCTQGTGEICKMYVEDWKDFDNRIVAFANDPDLNEHTKNMMRKFRKEIDRGQEFFTFEIEY